MPAGDIPDVREAVETLDGVSAASVRWPDPQGPILMRIEFAPEADRPHTTQRVLDTVRAFSGAEPETLESRVPAPPHRPVVLDRPVFSGLRLDRDQLDLAAEVTLALGARRVTGRAQGMATHGAFPQVAAEAALVGLRLFLPPTVRVQLEWVDVAAAGGGRQPIALVCVTCLTPEGEQSLVGSAIVREAAPEAAVRATLDALNRRLSWLLSPAD